VLSLRLPQLGVAILLAVTIPAAGAAERDSSLSRFQRIVLALQSEEQRDLRARFSYLSLARLHRVFRDEADLARAQVQRGRGKADLLGWAAAVDDFAASLAAAAADIEQGHAVTLRLGRQQVSAIEVGGRYLMLTHPRTALQGVYEQQVLLVFCSEVDCEGLLTQGAVEDGLPLYAQQVAPVWSFNERGAVCAHDTLQLEFAGQGNLSGQRQFCQQFFREVNDLVTEIAWAQLHGATIDWSSLQIRPTPGKTEHFIELNRSGDTALVMAPLLHSLDGVLTELAPWLSARSAGAPAPALVLDGRQRMAQAQQNRE
jgi:hypothetical protein